MRSDECNQIGFSRHFDDGACAGGWSHFNGPGCIFVQMGGAPPIFHRTPQAPPCITPGPCGASWGPEADSKVTANTLASTPVGSPGGFTTVAFPRESGLNNPAGIGAAPAGINHSS